MRQKSLNQLLQYCLKQSSTITKSTLDKLSPAQVRVLLAQDVLAQLDKKHFFAKTMIWLETFSCQYTIEYCEGCALGGLFLSTVDKLNSLGAQMVDDYYPEPDRLLIELKKYFEIKQLVIIEFLFEGSVNTSDGNVMLSSEELESAKKYYIANNLYRINSEQRMRHIMQNIINNEGTLVL